MLDAILSRIDLSSPSHKVLLTPSFINPGILKRTIALHTGRLANLRVRQVREFFVDRAAPLMHGSSVVAGEQQFWLMAELLRSLEPRLKYFGATVGFEGMCSLISSTIAELRLNGVRKDQLLSLPNRDKWEDMILIMEEYAGLKKQLLLFDYPDAITELLEHPEPLPHVFMIKHSSSVYEEQLAALCGMITIDPTPGTTRRYELSGFRVDTPYQEALQTVRNVIEDMKEAAVPVRIGICAADYHDAYDQITPVLRQAGHPDLIHFLKGEPILSTPAGNLWKYFAEWIQSSMSVYRLIRILESASFERGEVSPAVFHHAVRLFRQSPVVICTGEFVRSFRDFLDGREPVVDEDEERVERETEASVLALGLAKRFAVIPAATDLKDQLEALRSVFTECLRIRSESDAAAAFRIDAILDEALSSAGTISRSMGFPEVVALISRRLDGVFVHSILPDGTRPVLGTIDDLIYFTCDTLYVLGMNEKGPPGAFPENPILLDVEKQALRIALSSHCFRLREDRLREDEERFSLITATAEKRLVISAPIRDLTTGREMLFSRYFLNEWNRYHGRHEDYRGLSTALGRSPGSLNNYIASELEATFYDYELAVAAHAHHQRDRRTHPLLGEIFPFAAAVDEFRRHRGMARSFDEYWGVVHAAPGRALPVMSATRLGTWARCPYQYFLRHELFLDREEEFDARTLEWLDHLQYGSFLHELYYRFFLRLRKSKGEGFASIDEKDGRILDEEFTHLLDKYRALYPVTSVFHFEADVRRLRNDVAGFFERERLDDSSRLFVELSFAMGTVGDREPLLRREEPASILLKDGTTLQVRGSIDRVDRTADGRIRVIDYKSGRPYTGQGRKVFNGGEMMQAGLYSEVVNQIDATLRYPLFRYYYSTEKAGFVCYDVDYPEQREHFIALLTEMVKQIRSGNFVPLVAKREDFPCSFCDFNDVCMDGMHWLGERLKKEDPNHQRLLRIREEEA
jgi:RecB family exonuclease